MTYEAKNYDNLLGTKGFSDNLLKNHFKLYNGYVASVNAFNEKLKLIEPGTPEYAELKRRFGWEFNGMRLHELYFDNMVKDGKTLNKESKLSRKIVEQFGSYETWKKDFKGTGAMKGIGWAILTYDANANRLFNVWINEHDVGHLTGAIPLLVMDVFEHAFALDYGIDRASYISAFMNSIDWEIVADRLE